MSDLNNKLGIQVNTWMKLADGSYVGAVQTTHLYPKNICCSMEISKEDLLLSNLKLLKKLREQSAINEIISFYKQNIGECNVEIKSHIAG